MNRVVVIGAGVIGLSCAYSMTKRGFDVTVLDAGEIGGGASEGNAGWVTPSLSDPVPAPGILGQSLRWMLKSDSPLYIQPTLDPRRIMWLLSLWRHCNDAAYRSGLEATARLNTRTFHLFDRLELDGVAFEQYRTGLLFCFLDRRKRDLFLENLKLMRSYGYVPRPLGAEDAKVMEPTLSNEIDSGIFVEQERHVRPESLIAGLSKWLTTNAADVRARTEVIGFARSRERVVGIETREGVHQCDEVVVAAGAHTRSLARLLGVSVPIEAGKGYSLTYEPAPLRVRHALYLYETRVAVTPFDGILRLAGTMEFSGLNTDLRPRRVAALSRAAARYLDGWPNDVRGEAWAGMRPMMPDGLPAIGRISQNVTVASGHAMLGVTLAPATGEAVADLVATGRVGGVLQPFLPTRLSTPVEN